MHTHIQLFEVVRTDMGTSFQIFFFFFKLQHFPKFTEQKGVNQRKWLGNTNFCMFSKFISAIKPYMFVKDAKAISFTTYLKYLIRIYEKNCF